MRGQWRKFSHVANFTGTPYQFNPAAEPEIAAGTTADRGHVFPLSYFQLRYLFGHHGAVARTGAGRPL